MSNSPKMKKNGNSNGAALNHFQGNQQNYSMSNGVNNPSYETDIDFSNNVNSKTTKLDYNQNDKKPTLNEKEKRKDPHLWRDLVAYWMLGLCNNYGYVVMLSAAHDIIEQFNHYEKISTNDGTVEIESGRQCNILSTGTILLADIIPSLIMKIISPFTPFWINVRVFFAVAMATAGFLCVGFAETEVVAILGVILTSASAGLGETTFLAYSAKYNKNVISTWSSGTGGAGIAGSLSYAALKSINVGQGTSMFIMLVIPALECISFWVILRRPANIILPTINSQEIDEKPSKKDDIKESVEEEKPLIYFTDKIIYTLHLLKYMIPLTTVYIAEYFINQGLFELIFFENIFLDKASQYRWLNVDYQIGVFVSRSTVNLFSINRIWLLSVLQCINVFYFLFEVIYYITPSIWIVFAIVFWEGLLGGGAYVNTFYKMSKEISQIRQRFAIGMVALSDSVGISIAGFAAIPAHNAICTLIAPIRHYW